MSIQITGTIIDRSSTNSLVGAIVEALVKVRNDAAQIGRVTVNRAGRFSITVEERLWRGYLSSDPEAFIFFRVFLENQSRPVADTRDTVTYRPQDGRQEIRIEISRPRSARIRGVVLKHNNRPASGVTVLVREHKSDGCGVSFGSTKTNAAGSYLVEYVASRNGSGPVAMEVAIFADPDLNAPLVSSGALKELPDEAVLDLLLPAPAETIESLNSVLKQPLSPELLQFLQEKHLHSLADLRDLGGLPKDVELPGGPHLQEIELLNSVTALSVIENSPRVYASLAEQGIRTVAEVASFPRGELRELLRGELNENQLDSLVVKSAIASVELSNKVVAKRLHRNGSTSNGFDDLFRLTCSCNCAAATSAQAYLNHLLRFTLRMIRYEGRRIDASFLQQTFKQPLRDLPATCASSETEIAQARIAVEVLRRYLTDGGRAIAAGVSPSVYLETAREHMLKFLNLTWDELRNAFFLPDLKAKSLFLESKGLSRELISDGQMVDDLYNNLNVSVLNAPVFEGGLQTYFGLRSTHLNPLDADEPDPIALVFRRDVLLEQWNKADASPERPLGTIPIVDPHLISETDLVNTTLRTPTDDIDQWWPADFLIRRRAEFQALEATVASAFNVQPGNTLGQQLRDLFVQLASNRLSLPPSQVLMPPFGFAVNGEILDYTRLKAICNAADSNQDISADLAKFQISEEDVRALVHYIDLVEANRPVTEQETLDFRLIIVAHAKRVGFWPEWLQQESANLKASAKVGLVPNGFRLRVKGSESPDAAFVARPRLVEAQERRRWEDVLSARINIIDELKNELARLAIEVETRWLTELRNTLIANTGAGIIYTRQKVDTLTDKLQLDFEAGGCQRTTRVTQAIQTIQGLLFGARNGLLNDARWTLDEVEFDEIWRWLGSYDTWRSAVMAFLYPEHLLRPSLRRSPSPGFADALQLLRDQEPIGQPEAKAAHDVYARYLNDVAGLDLIAGASRILVTGAGGVERTAEYLLAKAQGERSNRFYCSVAIEEFDGPGDQSWWHPITNMRDVDELHGASLCGKFVVALTSSTTADTKALNAWRLPLPSVTLSVDQLLSQMPLWEGPFALELPGNTFLSVNIRPAAAGTAPVIVIEADEQTIYTRPLKLDATGWSGKFRSTPNQSLWHELGQADPYFIQPANNATFACRNGGIASDETVSDGRFVFAADVDGDGADEIIACAGAQGFWAMKLYAVGPQRIWMPLGRRPTSQRLDCTLTPSISDLYFAGKGDFDGTGIDQVVLVNDSRGTNLALDLFVRKWNSSNNAWEAVGSSDAMGSQIHYPRQYWNPLQCIVGRFTQELRDEVLITFADMRVVSSQVTDFVIFGLVNGAWEEVMNTSVAAEIALGSQAQLRGGAVCSGNFLGRSRHQLVLQQLRRGVTATATGRLWTLSVVNGVWNHVGEIDAGAISDDPPPRMIARDFDGDGLDELAFADNSPTVRFFKWGSGSWERTQTVTRAAAVNSMAAGDIDRDGAIDLIVQVQGALNKGQIMRWDDLPAVPGAQPDLSLTPTAPVPIRNLIAGRFAGREQPSGIAALGTGSTFYVQAKRPRLDGTQSRPKIEMFKPSLAETYSLFSSSQTTERLLSPESLAQESTQAFALNLGNRPRNKAYLEEAFYFLIVETAMRLQAAGFFSHALEWLELVARLIGTRLEPNSRFLGLDATGTLDDMSPGPIYDPLDAHSVARRRAGSYGRFTLASIVRLLVEYADAEFSLASAESLPRARELYLSALGLLRTHPYAAALDSCNKLIDEFLGELAASNGMGSIVADVGDRLREINDAIQLNDLIAAIRAVLSSEQPIQQKISAIRNLLRTESPGDTLSVADRNQLENTLEQTAHLVIMRDSHEDLRKVADGIERRVELIKFWRNHHSIPLPQLSFCVPPSKVLVELKRRIELALERLRNCKDIAGNNLVVLPIGATLDQSPANVLATLSNLRPVPYRFQTLIERTKQLLEIARQIESTMLSYIETAERKRFEVFNARRDLALTKAAEQLRAVQVEQASRELGVSVLQRDRAQDQVDHWSQMTRDGLSGWETSGLQAQWSVFALRQQVVTSIAFKYAASPEGWVQAAASWGGDTAKDIVSAQAEALGALAQARFTQAEYERRAQTWAFNRREATRDVQIGQQQIMVAATRLQGAQSEAQIAALQTAYANEAVTLLTTKSFANEALYEWMAGVLEGVYRFFLQQATQLARLAELQLAFERQEVPQGFIKSSYTTRMRADGSPDVASSSNGSDSLKGLTGAARLLRDVYQLDQYAFAKNQRKQQLTEVLSLVRLDPLAFQQFRESGRIAFETPIELFDRKFPGHYVRLLRRVRVSVIALIPPTLGVRATLSNLGVSSVVIPINGTFQEVVVQRGFEEVSFTSPINATGQFELDAQPELLNPFEGSGVATRWVFDLPRAANPFDFRSIADILVSFEYTALSSPLLRERVIANLPEKLTGERVFSVRFEFPDAWYDLHNPDQTPTPLEVSLNTTRDDFTANLDNVRLTNIALQVRLKDGATQAVGIDYLTFQLDGSTGAPVGGAAQSDMTGVISTRRANGAAWLPILAALATAEPVGVWQLKFSPTMRSLFAQERVEDILLALSFTGRPPAWQVH